MKVYVVQKEEILSYKKVYDVLETHFTLGSASDRYDELVDECRKGGVPSGVTEEFDELHYESYFEGHYPESHIIVKVSECELLDVASCVETPKRVVLNKCRESVYNYPNGKTFKCRFNVTDEDVYKCEYRMSEIHLKGDGYGAYKAVMYIMNDVEPADRIRLIVYADKNKDIYHCEVKVGDRLLKMAMGDEKNGFLIE
jgi:hypothetical protein